MGTLLAQDSDDAFRANMNGVSQDIANEFYDFCVTGIVYMVWTARSKCVLDWSRCQCHRGWLDGGRSRRSIVVERGNRGECN